MAGQRVHSVTTTDGVRIAGTVHGQGPPLVLLQGVMGDGDLDWQVLVRHLAGRFTCHLPSWRGRGLSGDHPDLGFGRLVDDAGYLDAAGRYVPDLLDFFRQLREYRGPTHEDPALLGAISSPVLVLIGSETKPFAVAYAQHVADHVPSATLREIPGAGHAAPLTHPEAVPEALTEFFSPAQQPS